LTDGAGSFVIGGAGFIGSHLVDSLIQRSGVTVYDNLSVGRQDFIQAALAAGRCRLVQGDVLDLEQLTRVMHGHELVFHLAANPEARWGLDDPRLDLEQGTIATWNVLEAMRRNGIRRLVFASSGTVYGNTAEPRSEFDLGHLPISLYGAAKLAGEGLIGAWVECFGVHAWILRFGNVVGPRGTHGAALDFFHKLQQNPADLEVLGDGRQAKPYLHVSDCVSGMLFACDRSAEPLNVFNLAPRDVTSVRRIAELCVAASPYPRARIRYTGGAQGWPGDIPTSRLDPGKLARLGWKTSLGSDEAVERAVGELAVQVFGASRGSQPCRP
jgi:UDP-glucose 4-epimerase